MNAGGEGCPGIVVWSVCWAISSSHLSGACLYHRPDGVGGAEGNGNSGKEEKFPEPCANIGEPDPCSGHSCYHGNPEEAAESH